MIFPETLYFGNEFSYVEKLKRIVGKSSRNENERKRNFIFFIRLI
ncbi:hypothetical protein LEP1GSC062_0086 [Leptospira alexanderi serovar Manhao 3 str. L 60]|uniref:Uncharacterized protein n=1 Tax=Leptospira alexanderi serovar Manhao 3 str. L 60 TaxID=1049759 RepID=V6IDB0_9LEPT|nr:hypothetical protein LEP1GSC062_0086 [Leptospira alexanderi serovar Manhao 3 str. L 60]